MSVETLLHKTALTSSWPTGLMVDATPHGAEGNLMTAVAVAAAGTESTVVDVWARRRWPWRAAIWWRRCRVDLA